MKTIYLGIMALMLFASFSLVLAEENESASSNASVNVSEEIEVEFNESVSSWDVNQEKMKNWFTFNQEKKAEREFKIARMLLVKAKIEAKNNNTKAMEKALESHNEILIRLEERVRNAKEDNNESGAAEKVVALERAIQVHEMRIEKLNSILTSENLTDEQRSRIEMKIAKAENVSAMLSEIQLDRFEKLKVRLMAVGNISEEQADAILAELSSAQGVPEMRYLLKERRKELLNDSEIRYERRQEMKDGKLEIREKIREKRLENQSEDLDENESDDSDDSDEDDSEDSSEVSVNMSN